MAATGTKQVRITELRQDVYNILDEVIASGVPLEIDRKGAVLTVQPPVLASKLDRLKKFAGETIWEGNPDDIFQIDHLQEWREEWGIENRG